VHCGGRHRNLEAAPADQPSSRVASFPARDTLIVSDIVSGLIEAQRDPFMRTNAPRNVTRYWQDGGLKGLSLLRAELTDQEFPPHVHEALVVVVTEEGGASVRCGGRSETAQPASLLVCNPGEPHSGSMGGSRLWRYRGLYFETRALDCLRDILSVSDQPYFRRSALADAGLANAFLTLHRTLESTAADAFQAQEMMVQAMGLLYARHGDGKTEAEPAGRNRLLLGRALAILRQRFREPLQLGDVAQALDMTPFQLIGLFKREFGLTPYALLTQIRLNAACSLMKRGGSIAECATAAGFYDQAALSKHFRTRFAITPAQYAVAAA
jgi:AraC-like DNA-binding protein